MKGAIVESMNKCSCEAQSGSAISEKGIEEHEAHIVTEDPSRITQAAKPRKLLQSCRSISQSAGCPRPEARSRRSPDPQRNRTSILPGGATRDSAPCTRQ